MKTKTQSKIASVVLSLIIFLICSSKTMAQGPVCPYPITNNMGCSVVISYTIFGNGTACTPITGQTIAGHGGVLNVACISFSNCSTQGPYDIAVEITNIGGQPVPTPQTVRRTSTGPFYFGPCSGDPNISTSCYVGLNEDIIWASTGTSMY